jgi:hypothetical protein
MNEPFWTTPFLYLCFDCVLHRNTCSCSVVSGNSTQHSKKWKSQFDAFLQKVLKLGPSVNFLLPKWIDDCKNLAGDTGHRAFTNITVKAVENQLEQVEHAEDPNAINMYIEIPAGKASSLGLSKWQSKHSESAQVEKGHESLTHYTNSRCAPEFKDIITLGGMAARNVRRRWICKLNELKLKAKEVRIPVECQDQLPFWDHSSFGNLNKCAKDHNLRPLFLKTTPVSMKKMELNF